MNATNHPHSSALLSPQGLGEFPAPLGEARGYFIRNAAYAVLAGAAIATGGVLCGLLLWRHPLVGLSALAVSAVLGLIVGHAISRQDSYGHDSEVGEA